MGKRKSKQIEPSKKVLILCEGKTEENYFKGIVFAERLTAISVKVYQPNDYSPFGLATEAKLRKKEESKKGKIPYDEVWIVHDKDGHARIPDAWTMANDNNIKIAFSSVSFEYWFLLHFRKTTKQFTSCDDLIKELENDYPNYSKTHNHYKELENKLTVAIENAEWVLGQVQNDLDRGIKKYDLKAFTDVNMLVNYLKSLSK